MDLLQLYNPVGNIPSPSRSLLSSLDGVKTLIDVTMKEHLESLKLRILAKMDCMETMSRDIEGLAKEVRESVVSYKESWRTLSYMFALFPVSFSKNWLVDG